MLFNIKQDFTFDFYLPNSEEIRRNKSLHERWHKAEIAQARHEKRQMNKGNRCKLNRKEKLKKHVIEKLEEDWSPQQIAGELRER